MMMQFMQIEYEYSGEFPPDYSGEFPPDYIGDDSGMSMPPDDYEWEEYEGSGDFENYSGDMAWMKPCQAYYETNCFEEEEACGYDLVYRWVSE